MTEEDEIVLYVEGYMSNDGSGRINQVSITRAMYNVFKMHGRQMYRIHLDNTLNVQMAAVCFS